MPPSPSELPKQWYHLKMGTCFGREGEEDHAATSTSIRAEWNFHFLSRKEQISEVVFPVLSHISVIYNTISSVH